MKNPWMSAWLSAANTMTSASRGMMAAEMSRQQTQMIKAWSEASAEYWRVAMNGWLPHGTRRR
jgi:hypothetical protein